MNRTSRHTSLFILGLMFPLFLSLRFSYVPLWKYHPLGDNIHPSHPLVVPTNKSQAMGFKVLGLLNLLRCVSQSLHQLGEPHALTAAALQLH